MEWTLQWLNWQRKLDFKSRFWATTKKKPSKFQMIVLPEREKKNLIGLMFCWKYWNSVKWKNTIELFFSFLESSFFGCEKLSANVCFTTKSRPHFKFGQICMQTTISSSDDLPKLAPCWKLAMFFLLFVGWFIFLDQKKI